MSESIYRLQDVSKIYEDRTVLSIDRLEVRQGNSLRRLGDWLLDEAIGKEIEAVLRA